MSSPWAAHIVEMQLAYIGKMGSLVHDGDAGWRRIPIAIVAQWMEVESSRNPCAILIVGSGFMQHYNPQRRLLQQVVLMALQSALIFDRVHLLSKGT